MSQVNVFQLPMEQLEGLKKQLDSDMQSLGAAFDGLYMGRTRFLDNAETVDQYRTLSEEAEASAEKKEIMVCMTSSLFVRGYVVPKKTVLVDVGTGYYLEQPMDQARKYFLSRAAQIKDALDSIEKTIVSKQKQQNQVVDALQTKAAAIQRQYQLQEQKGDGSSYSLTSRFRRFTRLVVLFLFGTTHRRRSPHASSPTALYPLPLILRPNSTILKHSNMWRGIEHRLVHPLALRGVVCHALLGARRCQSGPTIKQSAEPVKFEQVWQLWNEGNLFSLSVREMADFLQRAGVSVDPGERKAGMVRRLEEYLHQHDGKKAGGAGGKAGAGTGGDDYGRLNGASAAPETLLDLSQSGFYEGAANMAPKAFQLLVEGSVLDAVVSRLNTTSFPGFPANTECYTLTNSPADVSLRSRFSKVLQWCALNMHNLQMDGELHISLGKLLLEPSTVVGGERVVSAYTLQQRLQLHQSYNWVSALPPSAVPVAESFLEAEGFTAVTPSADVTYEGFVKRAADRLHVELDNKGQLTGLHAEWVHLQTAHQTHREGPDVRLLLRSRPPANKKDMDTFQGLKIVELTDDDVSDALPPEHGQLVYLSENVTKRFERVTERGVVIAVTQIHRQPLIVLHDDEEDPRVEFHITVQVPAASSNKPFNIRGVGLDMFDLAAKFREAVKAPFTAEQTDKQPLQRHTVGPLFFNACDSLITIKNRRQPAREGADDGSLALPSHRRAIYALTDTSHNTQPPGTRQHSTAQHSTAPQRCPNQMLQAMTALSLQGIILAQTWWQLLVQTGEGTGWL
eukprot:gene10217-7161_t